VRSASNAAPPLGVLETPRDIIHILTSYQTGQEWLGSNHHAIICNRHGEELLSILPPILTLYTWFMCTQCTEQPPCATIPTIGIRSNHDSRLQGLDPLRESNYKGEHATPATGSRMTGRIAIMPKDRNHSLNSGAHTWHVAAVPKVPTPCIRSTNHVATR
jgi:hypothetical protein